MPGPDATMMRDNMLARMEMATPGGPRYRETKIPHFPIEQLEQEPPRDRSSFDALPNVAEEPGFKDRMRAKEDPLHRFDAAQTFAAGQRAYQQIFNTPLPAYSQLQRDLAVKAQEMRRALAQGKRVVLTAGGETLAIYEPTPGAVLAACLRRVYAATGRVTPTMLDAARSILPGVDPEALRLAIEGALLAESHQLTSKEPSR